MGELFLRAFKVFKHYTSHFLTLQIPFRISFLTKTKHANCANVRTAFMDVTCWEEERSKVCRRYQNRLLAPAA